MLARNEFEFKIENCKMVVHKCFDCLEVLGQSNFAVLASLFPSILEARNAIQNVIISFPHGKHMRILNARISPTKSMLFASLLKTESLSESLPPLSLIVQLSNNQTIFERSEITKLDIRRPNIE